MYNKIEEIEKIHQLKESGAITQEEFDKEKQKILNSQDKSKENTKISKANIKPLKIVGLIILVIVIVIICFFGGKAIKNKTEIIQFKKEISSINVEELEETIIEKLENSSLKLNGTVTDNSRN